MQPFISSFNARRLFASICLYLGFLVATTNVGAQEFLAGDFAKKFDLAEPEQAIDLSQIIDSNDEFIDLETLKDRVVLVNFWATWCVPCRHEMPTLNKAAEQWGDKGLTVLTVSVDRTAKMAKAYLKKNGLASLTFGYDAKMDIFSSLDGLGLPFTLLIDRKGNKFGHLSGPADWSDSDAEKLFNHLL